MIADFWTLRRAASALGVVYSGDGALSGISTDTRSIVPGGLFVALRGERFDAHDFLAQAVQLGAGAVVVSDGSRAAGLGVPVLVVEDTLVALGALGRYHRVAWSRPVVAIAGSNGKTTTKELIRSALGSTFDVHATERNLNNQVGVPLTLLALTEGADVAVIEVGSNQPGEIATLREIVLPNFAVITTVQEEHLEGFGDLAGVMAEEMSLCDGADLAIVPAAEPEVVAEARARAHAVVTAGLEAGDVHPDAWGIQPDGLPWLRYGDVMVRVPVPGAHNAANAAIAMAAARAMGVADADAARGIATATIPPMRSAVAPLGDAMLVNDAYNANPASMLAALALLETVGQGRQAVAILGTMRELGARTEALHDTIARAVLATRVSVIGAVGEFAAAFARVAPGDARVVAAADPDGLWEALEATPRPQCGDSPQGVERRAAGAAATATGGLGPSGVSRGRNVIEGTFARPHDIWFEPGSSRSPCATPRSSPLVPPPYPSFLPPRSSLLVLYYFLVPLKEHFGPFNLFTYITFRAAGAAVTAALVGVRPWAGDHPLAAGEARWCNSSERGRRTAHQAKSDTPTMGGLIIIAAGRGADAALGAARQRVRLAGAACDAVDGRDRLSRRLPQAEAEARGEDATKGSSSATSSLDRSRSAWRSGGTSGSSRTRSLPGASTTLPFFKYVIVVPAAASLAWLYVPFVAFVLTGTSNAVNLTDGLDGLAAGLCGIAFAAFGLFMYVQGRVDASAYLQLFHIRQAGELTVFCLAFFGAAVGFLWFNAYPAQVFMGDTGSLALGGALGAMGILLKSEFLLLIIGGVFVAETLSVIMQRWTFRYRRYAVWPGICQGTPAVPPCADPPSL